MTPPVYLTNQLVDFADGGNVFAFAFLDVNGNASITTSTLTDGVHNITAIYGGNEGFLFSISPVLTQVVMHSGAASSSNTLLTPTPQTFFRQSANFNVLTPGSGGISPTGNVILLEGNRQLGPLLTLNSGTQRTPFLLLLSHTAAGRHASGSGRLPGRRQLQRQRFQCAGCKHLAPAQTAIEQLTRFKPCCISHPLCSSAHRREKRSAHREAVGKL